MGRGNNNDYRDVLRQLVGPEGEPGYGWALGSGVPMCEWEGIVCGGGQYGDDLLVVNLESKFLDGGSLSDDFGRITTLKTLRLNATSLIGTIPPSIGQLPFLEEFTVSDNEISGTVPMFISPTLHTLNISHNALVGTLGANFYFGHVGHDKLLTFDAESNQLSGTLSEAIGMWHSLETLSLSDNQLTGTLPKTLGVLTTQNLKYIYLDTNRFVGTIPSDFIGGSKSVLEDLWLHENMLSGTIPSDFADILAAGGTGKLGDFYIDGNKLTGIIPPELCGTKDAPVINADFFQDVYDTTDESKHPENPCDILSCPMNTYSLEGMFPCQPCPANEIMPWLGGEEYCLKNQPLDILRKFYSDTNGQSWTLPPHRNNWFAHNLKDNYCAFEGIECNDEGHVVEILLNNVGLRGTITPDIGLLEHLQHLDLSDNKLTGGLPSELRFASSLTMLDVSGNQLHGPVPPMLCKVPGINGNGQGGALGDEYKCDYVACPPGTASELGRESLDGSMTCTRCSNPQVNTLALKNCNDYEPPQWMIDLKANQSNMSSSTATKVKAVGGILLAISFTIALCALGMACYKRRQKRQRQKVLNSINDHQPTLDEMFQHLSAASPDRSGYAFDSPGAGGTSRKQASGSLWHVGGDAGKKKHTRPAVNGTPGGGRRSNTNSEENRSVANADDILEEEDDRQIQSLEMITQMQRRNKTSSSFVYHQAANDEDEEEKEYPIASTIPNDGGVASSAVTEGESTATTTTTSNTNSNSDTTIGDGAGISTTEIV